MYLFDTDCLCNILKRNPSPLLLERLRTLPKNLQFTTSINVSEIYYGAYRSKNQKEILAPYEGKVFVNVNILPFDTESGKVFGRLKAQLEKKGISKSESELRIAAIAIQHDMVVITGDKRHFDNIPGLSVEDWMSH
jgi:tRNA(fMet)-specific endonuclease VapC